MFRSKKDVDRHVQDIFRKLKNENEKNLRCYNIAKLYYQVGEYESARRYVSSYLEVREGSAGAHKLLGQALEALGHKESALAQYKISLELEGRQDDLVLKVCELLADMDVAMDVNRVRYWVERADKQFPHHPVVFQLKEKMLTVERPNDNSEDLEALIASELSARPTDVHLRVKLIKHYILRHKLDDAYKHAADVESTHGHRNCIVWYQCLSELLTKCKENKHSDFSFWILYVSTLERYAALSLKEQGSDMKKTIPEAMQAVFNFDQSLTEFHSKGFFDNPTFSEHMVTHMWGQLHFHLACLLLRKTKREQGSWSEAGRLCSPLLLGALHVSPIDPAASWATHLKEQFKSHIRLWYKEGSYRCSQAGHVLQDYARDDTKKLMDKIDKFCTGLWRERIYQRIFISRIFQQMIGTSFFTNHTAVNPPLRLCSHSELKQYDEVSEEVWPDSLHHQVWLGIKSRPHSKSSGPHPHMYSHVFPELQFSVYNLNQTAPDSLSRLDIDAFLNAAVLCSSVVLVEDQQLNDFLSPDRLPTLPADLTTSLCTSAQEKWWSSAYKMYFKQEALEGDIGEIRQELQRGLEVVRCIGNHGLHPTLLVHLARIFHHRAKVLKEKDKEHSDIPALEARCRIYWSTAIPLLERLQNNQTIRISTFKLFKYQGKDMNNVELTNALEEGRLLLAQKFVRDKQFEQAIDALQALRCPEASFQQGQIYKIMADELVSSMPRESLTSEMRSQHVIMLSRARNCFYLTLDRLRSPGTNPKHPLNAELCTHISEIENELKRIEPDLWCGDLSRNGCDGMSDESYSSANSGVDQPIANVPPLPTLSGISTSVNMLSTPQKNTHRTSKQTSTPCRPTHQDILDLSRNRTEARPSPERLDAQIRQMIHSRDNVMQTIIEQNKAVLDSHKTILEKIDELCKEMAELRKETQKQRQTPAMNSNLEEDLYVLGDEDYGDLNYNANQADPSAMASNMFTPSHRHPYSQLVYPSATAFQGYYQGGIPFNDPNAQAIPSLYPPNMYPMPVIYPNRQKLPDNLMQQGLFTTRLPTQLTTGVDLMTPAANQAMQMQAMQKLDVAKPPEPSVAIPVPVQVPVQVPAPVPSLIPIIKDVPVNKAPPVNVVITTSDTLPTTVPASRLSGQPTLSVTIPPQYRLGTAATISTTDQTNVPHCYQITMPLQATIPTTVNLPPLPATLITTPANMSTSVVQTDSNLSSRPSASLNTSADLCELEHDPIPDFVPVIPLPAEVKVTTGEENETTLYCARAKLFRFVGKEWKERGVGNVKLLQNAEGKVRLLMRRDQVLKICANHLLRPDMELTAMLNNDKAWIWVANDFADEEVKLERLCIKFKTVEEAQAFKEHFDKARTSLTDSPEKSFKAIDDKVTSDAGNLATPISDDLSKNTTPDKSKTTAAATVVGGFSFSTKPIIQNVFNTEATKATNPEETKPSPFSRFSFNKPNKPPEIGGYSPTTTTPTTPTTMSVKKADTTETTSFGSPSTGFSFVKTAPHAEATTTFASNMVDTTTTVTVQPSVKAGDGTVTASSAAAPKTLRRPHATAPSKSGSTTDIARKSDGIDSQIEPDESILFEQRAHLQYYNRDNKQWEDRGVGPMKILLGSKSRKMRLLMHDERTSKTCYSHSILSDTKFAFKRGSNTAVTWTIGKDENKPETYALLFKLPEHALQFYNHLLSNQQKLAKDRTAADNKKQEPKKFVEEINESGVKQQPKLSEMFKPAVGSWECNACYTRNRANDMKCLACESPAPSSAANTGGSAAPASKTTPVTSSNQVPLSQLYKPPPGSWRCETCYISNVAENICCVACDTPKDPSMPPKPKGSSFNLGSSASEATPTFSFGIPQDSAKEVSGGFTFRMPKSDDKGAGDASTKTNAGSIFGAGVKTDDSATNFTFGATPRPSTPPNKGSPFTFGSPGKSFGFQFSTKSPVKSPGGGATSEEEVENDDIHFSPIIPLPDKIEVKTGEEDEEILYSHRAKLFRYDSSCKEWKERGLGDIKLLKHKESGKLRLIMRRDQILKLCLNHFVLPDIEFTPKDEKTWLWNAADYSEGEIEYMQFACRFKTSDIAGEFKKAIDEARKAATSNKEAVTTKAPTKELTKTSSSQDIQVLYELKVTEKEKAAALKLQLPENFYAYKQKEDCPGCLGCKEPGIPLFDDNKSSDKSSFANVPLSGTGRFDDDTSQKSPFSVKLAANEKTPSKTVESSVTSVVTTPSQTSDASNTSTTSTTKAFTFFAPKATTAAPVKLSPRTSTYTFENYQPQKSAGFVFGAKPSISSSDATVTSNGSTDQTKTAISSTQSNFENFNICSPSGETQTQKTAPLPTFGGSVDHVFGRTQPTFAEGAQTYKPISSIFGSPTTSSSNIFGGNATETTASSLIKPSYFNVSSSTPTSTPTTVSSSESFTKSSTPIFGTASTTGSSFSSSTISFSTSLTSGSGSVPSGPVFGTAATTGFGNAATFRNSATAVFGTHSSATFGSAAATLDSASTSNSGANKETDGTFVKDNEDVSFLPTDNVTFSTLAAKQTQPVGFKTDPNFSFVGAGSFVFGSSSSNKESAPVKKNQSSPESNKKDTTEDDNENEKNDNEHDHDPHFEPIIPLPDAIEVRTGEEDEEKVFSERAKLYRHDGATKEWKERGVGEMKILHHTEHGTYRLLLRREQVHKVVCNFLIKPDVEFRTLSCSDRAWVWAGMNHAEDPPSIENLAIKFKNADVAARFKSIIDRVQQELRDRSNAQGGKNEVVITEEDQDVDDEEEEDENDDGEDDEDEVEASIVFEKRATLLSRTSKDAKWKPVALGNLIIYYNLNMFGAKIILKADETGEVVSHTIIGVDTVMEVDGKECIWTEVDYACSIPTERTLKAVFSSTQAAQQMFKSFQESLDCVKQAGIIENV